MFFAQIVYTILFPLILLYFLEYLFPLILFQSEFLMNNVHDITNLDNLCFNDKNIIYM